MGSFCSQIWRIMFFKHAIHSLAIWSAPWTILKTHFEGYTQEHKSYELERKPSVTFVLSFFVVVVVFFFFFFFFFLTLVCLFVCLFVCLLACLLACLLWWTDVCTCVYACMRVSVRVCAHVYVFPTKINQHTSLSTHPLAIPSLYFRFCAVLTSNLWQGPKLLRLPQKRTQGSSHGRATLWPRPVGATERRRSTSSKAPPRPHKGPWRWQRGNEPRIELEEKQEASPEGKLVCWEINISPCSRGNHDRIWRNSKTFQEIPTKTSRDCQQFMHVHTVRVWLSLLTHCSQVCPKLQGLSPWCWSIPAYMIYSSSVKIWQ